MPTYEYECLKCGDKFDVFQSIVEEPLKKCPACKGKVRRCIGAGAGVIFKGSGFYQTDYRSDNYKKAAQAEKASANSGEGKSKGSSDKNAKKTKE